jgi:hypothetical protein
MGTIETILCIIVCTAMAMIGYHIHGSIFWAVMDFLFWPFALIKWLVCHEITWPVIKATFAFFLK